MFSRYSKHLYKQVFYWADDLKGEVDKVFTQALFLSGDPGPPSISWGRKFTQLFIPPFKIASSLGFDSIMMIIVMIIIMTVIVMISIMIVSTIIRTLGTPHHSLREPKLPPHTCFWQFSLESIFHNMKRHIFLSLLLPPLHYYLHHHYDNHQNRDHHQHNHLIVLFH